MSCERCNLDGPCASCEAESEAWHEAQDADDLPTGETTRGAHEVASQDRPDPVVGQHPGASSPSSSVLPHDQRAALDAYWTPPDHAVACCRFLRDVVGVRPSDALEPAVGGGAWVRAVRTIWPGCAVDRLDIDPHAPGLHADRWRAERATVGPFLQTVTARRYDLVPGNPPYSEDITAWVDASLNAAPVVAFLLRCSWMEGTTGTPKRPGRLSWFTGRGRPSWIVHVSPRPKWQGPGARPATDSVGSVLVVWDRRAGIPDEPRTRWLDVRA